MKPPSRQPWNYTNEAKAFHAKHGRQPYTMVWNKTLEAEMMDASLPKEWRVLAAIKRFSWGNLSDWAVDGLPEKDKLPKPRPITQDRLGEILNLSPASISEACTDLKEGGYLNKDHQFLCPEEKVDPLESTTNDGVDSNSANLHSSFLRFRESVLSEDAELASTVSGFQAGRKECQEKAKEFTREIRKIDLRILGLWRDSQKTGTSSTLVHECAQSNYLNGEHKEKIGSVCNESYTTEQHSNSKTEWFATPEPPPLESESYSAKKPNKKPPAAAPPLKPLNLKGESAESVSVSQSTQPTDRPTDRPAEILAAIPAELLSRLRDTPTPRLLERIDQKLAGAPLQEFTERIKARWETITALGLLVSLADDVGRAHRKAEADVAAGIPPIAKPMSREDAKRQRLLDGLEIMDKIQGRVG